MTLHELNELRFIDQEIENYKEKIIELRTMAESITANYSGMPRGGGDGKKIERCAIAIVSYKEMLDKALCERIEKSEKIHKYILGIDDAQTRQIMFLRFVQAKSWGEVAREIGGYNSPSSVRMRVIRYIDGERGNENGRGVE